MTEPTPALASALTHASASGAAGTALPAEVRQVFERSLVSEYASLTRAGHPVTWPITPFVGERGTLDLTTGLGYPDKAERARRNPRVALLYSDPAGNGPTLPPVVLVQGRAAVRDADLQANTDRFVRESPAKSSGLSGTPWFVVRRWSWYFARIYVEVTPERVLWWPDGDLSRTPRTWACPADTVFPASDPAPSDSAPSDPASRGPRPSSRFVPPADWQPYANRAERLGEPVVSMVADGFPVTVRCRSSVRTDAGFDLRLPAGVEPAGGPVCLTFHRHGPAMEWQENVVLIGTATGAESDLLHVEVERALNDWSLAGGRAQRSRAFLGRRSELKQRMRTEADRRGQPIPAVRLQKRPLARISRRLRVGGRPPADPDDRARVGSLLARTPRNKPATTGTL